MDPVSGTPADLLARDAWIRQLAAAVARDDASGEDLAQETWLRALRGRVPFAVRDRGAWLSTLVRNAARNLGRSEARRQARERAAARSEVDPAADPFDLAVYEERRRLLVRAVEALPPAQRDVVVARYWEGLEPAAIARRNGEEPAAVRQRLRRALAGLRARLDRDAPGGRAAWLAPLLGGAGGAGALAGTVVLVGGLTMKKVLAMAAGLLLVALLGSVGAVALGWFGPDPVPGSSGAGFATAAGDGAAGPAISPPGAGRVAVQARRADVDADHAPRYVLLTADGAPRPDVAYWADERPHRTHGGRAPAHALRTGPGGSFSPASRELGDGSHLWFEIDPGSSLAIDRDAVPLRVRIPRRRDVAIEIRALPADEPWEIGAWPAWQGRRSLTHGRSHAALDPRSGDSLWIVRRTVTRSARTGPARVRLRLFADWPVAVYCSALGYDVRPHIQELERPPPRVVAHTAEHRQVIPFEVVERDRVTRVAIGGRAFAHRATWSAWRDFEGGRGAIAWSDSEAAHLRFVSFALRDGEVFRVAAAGGDARLTDGKVLRLARGTGRAPALRLEVPEAVSAWPAPRVHVELDGALVRAGSFDHFTPHDAEGDVAAWFHAGRLVVQTPEPSGDIGALLLVAADGRVARSVGSRLVASPAVEMQPIEPGRLVERWAVPAGVGFAQLRHEVELPPHGWVRAGLLRLHRVDGLGWRLSRTASIDVHEPLLGRIRTFAPEGARSRLRLWLRGERDPIVLPHPPLR